MVRKFTINDNKPSLQHNTAIIAQMLHLVSQSVSQSVFSQKTTTTTFNTSYSIGQSITNKILSKIDIGSLKFRDKFN